MKYGYARVSTEVQSLDLQIERLKKAGCGHIVEEKFSGRDISNRPYLDWLLANCVKGDEIVCIKIDRLARSVRDVLNIVHDLDKRGVVLRILEPEVCTGGLVGRLILTIFGLVGELELSIMRERQMAGIARAKAEGKFKGRALKLKAADVAEISRLRNRGAGATAIAKQVGISRSSVYRVLNKPNVPPLGIGP